jgi:hypothetical protein
MKIMTQEGFIVNELEKSNKMPTRRMWIFNSDVEASIFVNMMINIRSTKDYVITRACVAEFEK